jgi:hypothetical protein
MSRVLQHGAEIGVGRRSNRPLEAAEARGAGERFEFTVPLLFGKRKTGLGIASLGRFVTDVKRDRRPCVAGRRTRSERVVDQSLHQPAPAMGGARRHMLDQPIAVTALDPAGACIRAPPQYRGAIEARVACGLLARRRRSRPPAWRTTLPPAFPRPPRSRIAKRATRIWSERVQSVVPMQDTRLQAGSARCRTSRAADGRAAPPELSRR